MVRGSGPTEDGRRSDEQDEETGGRGGQAVRGCGRAEKGRRLGEQKEEASGRAGGGTIGWAGGVGR